MKNQFDTDQCPNRRNMIKIIKMAGMILMLCLLTACSGEKTSTEVPKKEVEATESKEKTEENETEKNEAETKAKELEEFFLSLSFEPIEMTMGQTHEFRFEKKMTDVQWVSSNEDVVQVVDERILAIAPGTATITVSLEENQKFIDVTVTGFSDKTLAVGCSSVIEVNEAMPSIRWDSSAPEIVSVNEGTIQSLAAGAAMITAYINEVPFSFEVVATTPTISTTSVRRIIGNTEQVFILGTNGHVEWKSDNTAIATVSEIGEITAEPTGAGHSTVVHAFVDGMEFKIDVEVEPIPQLSSTYKIYGYQNNDTYKNARITLCANANEITEWKEGDPFYACDVIKVLNVADADYSSDSTYPVYRTILARYGDEKENYTEIFLIGTSQKANVIIKTINRAGVLVDSENQVVYEEQDGYGVIKVYCSDNYFNLSLVMVEVDGYTYEFIIAPMEMYYFYYESIDSIPMDYVIEESSVEEVVTHQATDSTAIVANSRTYHTNNNWLERIGDKFVQEVQDQAIEKVAGLVLKWILPF